MGLHEYRRKRRFERTPEPRGGRADEGGPMRFVIQKHAARALHYDFRLEWDGVLKSWAVPKGPSLDPRDRRLAVEVEDHPVEYGGFEGVIPEGEYGGGTVLVWDRGRWFPDGDPGAGLRDGRLRFRLEGEKLHGSWSLVRMSRRGNRGGKTNWLLIKARDEAARSEAPAIVDARPESVATGRTLDGVARRRERVRPSTTIAGARKARLQARLAFELATLVDAPPAGDDWFHEVKLDGYRLFARASRGRVALVTRGGQDWTARLPAVARAVGALPMRSCLLDGELVALEPDGRSSFQALQRAFSEGRADDLCYCAFDLLHLDGFDTSGAPLEARKRALATLVGGATGAVRYGDHARGDGEAFFHGACRLGLEGIVSKRRDAPYRPGRSRDWLKVKCLARQEFVIGGYTDPEGGRTGLGALLLGVQEPTGLRYVGKVGTGFTDAMLRDLALRLSALERNAPPFREAPRGAGLRRAHWVEPRLVAEVAFTEWTRDGRLRHPSFVGLRDDKPAAAVVRERAATAGTTGPRLTNPDKALYPEIGLTKAGLAGYYAAIADWMLPHVVDRPVTLLRCPDGHAGGCFFQKHATAQVPPGLGTALVPERGGSRVYFTIEDGAGLASLVQTGALELHVGGARRDDLARPDRIVFDLDPAPDVPWARVVRAAAALRKRLEAVGLESWVKTTGGKGLHVVVPIARRHEWDEVTGFAEAVARAFARDDPAGFVAEPSKAKRAGRIFVDYLRNTPAATAVAPYSTRARAGAPVAAPLAWSELPMAAPSSFDVRTIPQRLGSLRSDPWADLLRSRQSLTAAALRDLRVR